MAIEYLSSIYLDAIRKIHTRSGGGRLKFSLRAIGLFVAWVAFVIAMMCQIRYEILRPAWSSGFASDLTWIVNLCFALVVVLIAIATRSGDKMYWVGCAVIAVALFVCQATDQRPMTVARFVSTRLVSLIVPDGHSVSGPMRESHVLEMGAVWTYALIPLLSLAGGAFAQWVYQKSSSPITGAE